MCFALFAIICSTLLYGLGPDFFVHYEDSRLVEKYQYLEQKVGTYDTIFFGSSSIARHIIPTLFDQRMDGEMTSFNMGIDGLKDQRMLNLVEQTTRVHQELQTVFIELRIPEREKRQNYRTNPILYAARFEYVPSVLGYIAKSNNSESERVDEYVRLGRELGYKYLGFGASKQVQLLLGIAPPADVLLRSRFAELERTRGFVVLPDTHPSRVSYVEGLEKGRNPVLFYKAEYANAEKQLPVAPATDLYAEDILELGLQLRNEGRTVYFILSPHPEDLPYLFTVAARLEQEGFVVFNMADPAVHPDFYELEYQFDWGHLNEAGAVRFTEQLADMVRALP